MTMLTEWLTGIGPASYRGNQDKCAINVSLRDIRRLITLARLAGEMRKDACDADHENCAFCNMDENRHVPDCPAANYDRIAEEIE